MLSMFIPIIYLFYFLNQRKNKELFSKKKTLMLLGVMFFITTLLFLLMPNKLEDNFYYIFRKTYYQFISEEYPNKYLNNLAFTQKYILYISIPIVLLGFKFYQNKIIKLLNVFFIPITFLFNLIGLPLVIYSFFGNFKLANINTLEIQLLLIMHSFMILSFIIHLKDLIKEGLPKNYKPYLYMLLVILIGAIITIPNIGPGIIFGFLKAKQTNYSPLHIFIITFSIITPFIIALLLQKITREWQEILLHFFTISLFVVFIDYYTILDFYNLSKWPIHLCHTAVYLILIAIWFKQKKLFYFTYFVNVIGTLFAIIFPAINKNYSFFSPEAVHFWQNHIGILFIPIIAVRINYFPKPVLKDMTMQALLFTIYFIFVSFVNAIFPTIRNSVVFGNSGIGVDYFFLNGTQISQYVSILRIAREKVVKTITINGVKSSIYLLHNLIIYISFITFTFGLIAVYNYIDNFILNFKNITREFIIRLKKHQKIPKLNKKELYMLNEKKAKLQINNFSKIYPGANFYSVKDFSLTINEGEIFGFIGHNGAGKSTLIKSLVGVNSYDGEISICDINLKLNPAQAKFLIGYVPDNHPLYERLTGREYIKYCAQIYMVEKKDYQARLDYYLELFNLTKDIDRLINTYSHGMKQKVSIIASLIHEPKIWILDEPLTGLDPTSVLMVKNCIINHAKKGNIVFFSSHIIEIVEGICDKIAIIKKGQLMYTGEVQNALKEYDSLTDLYKKYVLDYNA